jgi:hypothetical protein
MLPSSTRRWSVKDKLLGFLVDADLHERIRRAAFEADCSKGEIVRRAVVEYLGKRRTEEAGKELEKGQGKR